MKVYEVKIEKVTADYGSRTGEFTILKRTISETGAKKAAERFTKGIAEKPTWWMTNAKDFETGLPDVIITSFDVDED